MKIDINKQTYTKEEVIGLLDGVQDKVLDLLRLHERYRDSRTNKENESIEDGYVAAYNEANDIIVRFKYDLRGDF